jgi:ubiquinone/menaquinone biosynthesis C-methylase UbiE
MADRKRVFPQARLAQLMAGETFDIERGSFLMHNPDDLRSVEAHYGRGAVLDNILHALTTAGKNLAHLAPSDLAAVDEFHVRGREATTELAERAEFRPGERVLDVGCGLGGSVRYLAVEHGVRAIGVDLTKEYVDAARVLADMVGLAGQVEFRQASACVLPFEDSSFDVVWTEHVQMNIPDKRSFYAGLARVLAPGGRLVFHDIFQGDGGEPHCPVPWAEHPSISFLSPQTEIRNILEELGLTIRYWQDMSLPSQAWFEAADRKLAGAAAPPLGIHLLMGETAHTKVRNMANNFRERRITSVQAVCASR